MTVPSGSEQGGTSAVILWRFQITIWLLCGIATLFLASRFAIRMSTKGRLMVNDYFLVVAFPLLYLGVGLLQSTLAQMYQLSNTDQSERVRLYTDTAPRFTASIEMLWTTIYCVKFCFLAQFKFHKPPYAYVSKHLTRYYWSSIGICSAAVLVTLIQPIILCPNSDRCRYFRDASTVSLEMTVTALDIITDIFVISIPISLIYMANFTRLHTIINACFKCLSIFPIVVATARLALQYRAETRNINYIWVTFLLVVEAATAMIMASISSYRVVIIDYLAERRMRRGANLPSSKTYILGNGVSGREERIDIRLNDTAPQSSSVSELPMIHPAPTSPVGPTT